MAVSASFNGSSLTITGDGDSDTVAIVGTQNPGEFDVFGFNGTAVNGMGSARFPGWWAA